MESCNPLRNEQFGRAVKYTQPFFFDTLGLKREKKTRRGNQPSGMKKKVNPDQDRLGVRYQIAMGKTRGIKNVDKKNEEKATKTLSEVPRHITRYH